MTLVALVTAAYAACHVLGQDVRAASDGETIESRTVYVETGRVDCRRLDLGGEGRLESVRVRIRAPDDSVRRFRLRWKEGEGHFAGREAWRMRRGPAGWTLLLPELRFGDTVSLQLRREPGQAPEPLPDVPDADVIEVERVVDVRDDGSVRRSFLRLERTRTEPAAASRFVSYPLDSRDRWIVASVGGTTWSPIDEGGSWRVVPPSDGDLRLTWGWDESDHAGYGEETFREDRPVPRSLLVVKGALAASAASGDGGAFVARELAPVATDGLPAVPDPVVAWRVVRRGDETLFADRDVLLDLLEESAAWASLPEPGLPPELKRAAVGLDAVTTDPLPRVLEAARRWVTVSLPEGRDPIRPRVLLDARKSGWATPWEQALTVAILLGQVRIPADPILVRPASAGRTDPASPAGWTAAVVRVRRGSEVVWIDPACDLCALGELPADLWEGQALARGIDALPSGPSGRHERTADLRYDGTRFLGSATARLESAAALAFRIALADVPADDRAAWAARALGGEGAVLDSHEGLLVPGAPMAASVSVTLPPSLSPLPLDLLRPSETGELQVALPLAGTWTDRVRIHGWTAPESHVDVSADGLHWTRDAVPSADGTDVTESLAIDRRIVLRAIAAPFFARVAELRAGVPAGP